MSTRPTGVVYPVAPRRPSRGPAPGRGAFGLKEVGPGPLPNRDALQERIDSVEADLELAACLLAFHKVAAGGPAPGGEAATIAGVFAALATFAEHAQRGTEADVTANGLPDAVEAFAALRDEPEFAEIAADIVDQLRDMLEDFEEGPPPSDATGPGVGAIAAWSVSDSFNVCETGVLPGVNEVNALAGVYRMLEQIYETTQYGPPIFVTALVEIGIFLIDVREQARTAPNIGRAMLRAIQANPARFANILLLLVQGALSLQLLPGGSLFFDRMLRPLWWFFQGDNGDGTTWLGYRPTAAQVLGMITRYYRSGENVSGGPRMAIPQSFSVPNANRNRWTVVRWMDQGARRFGYDANTERAALTAWIGQVEDNQRFYRQLNDRLRVAAMVSFAIAMLTSLARVYRIAQRVFGMGGPAIDRAAAERAPIREASQRIREMLRTMRNNRAREVNTLRAALIDMSGEPDANLGQIAADMAVLRRVAEDLAEGAANIPAVYAAQIEAVRERTREWREAQNQAANPAAGPAGGPAQPPPPPPAAGRGRGGGRGRGRGRGPAAPAGASVVAEAFARRLEVGPRSARTGDCMTVCVVRDLEVDVPDAIAEIALGCAPDGERVGMVGLAVAQDGLVVRWALSQLEPDAALEMHFHEPLEASSGASEGCDKFGPPVIGVELPTVITDANGDAQGIGLVEGVALEAVLGKAVVVHAVDGSKHAGGRVASFDAGA